MIGYLIPFAASALKKLLIYQHCFWQLKAIIRI